MLLWSKTHTICVIQCHFDNCGLGIWHISVLWLHYQWKHLLGSDNYHDCLCTIFYRFHLRKFEAFYEKRRRQKHNLDIQAKNYFQAFPFCSTNYSFPLHPCGPIHTHHFMSPMWLLSLQTSCLPPRRSPFHLATHSQWVIGLQSFTSCLNRGIFV